MTKTNAWKQIKVGMVGILLVSSLSLAACSNDKKETKKDTKPKIEHKVKSIEKKSNAATVKVVPKKEGKKTEKKKPANKK